MTDTKTPEVTTAMPKAFQDSFFTVVPNDQRSDYLPSQFNNSIHDSGLFERELFRTAGYYCDKNVVLKWEMACVKSATGDTFFMYPSIDEPYLMRGLDAVFISGSDSRSIEYLMRGSDAVDNKLFGLIMTLITLNEGADRSSMEQEFSDILTNHHHALSKAIDACMVDIDNGTDDTLRADLISMFETIERYTE